MPLFIAKDSSLEDVISSDGTNPLTTEHLLAGESVDVQLFVFSNDPDKRYESIKIAAEDTTDTDESSWLTFAATAAGPFTSGPYNIPDITTPHAGQSFWVRVTTPMLADVVTKSDIKLRLTANAFAL